MIKQIICKKINKKIIFVTAFLTKTLTLLNAVAAVDRKLFNSLPLVSAVFFTALLLLFCRHEQLLERKQNVSNIPDKTK